MLHIHFIYVCGFYIYISYEFLIHLGKLFFGWEEDSDRNDKGKIMEETGAVASPCLAVNLKKQRASLCCVLAVLLSKRESKMLTIWKRSIPI